MPTTPLLMPGARRDVPPRDGLLRSSPFVMRAAEGGNGDGFTLDGYAAVFNTVSIIDSWEGRFKEQVAPGSMKRSFREDPPKIQFDHGRHPLIGSIPIARLESATEDTDPVLAPQGGAHVVGRMSDNWLIEPLRDAIANESIDGMSFRFTVLQDEWRDADGKKITDEEKLRELLWRSWMEDVPDDELLLRTLKQLKVPELGPVVWPAYTETSVGVRSITIDLGRLNEPGQRKALADAVFLADSAVRSADLEQPVTTAADEHPSERDDRQHVTVLADEHPSDPTPGLRGRIQRDAQFRREYLAIALTEGRTT